MDDYYILIFEDGQITAVEDIADHILQNADDGYYEIIKVSSDEEPKRYKGNGQWQTLEIQELSDDA